MVIDQKARLELSGGQMKGDIDMSGNDMTSGGLAVFTDLSGANANANVYSGTTFIGTTFSGTTLFGTNVSGVNVNGTNAVLTNLSGTNVNAVTFSGTTFKGTTLSGTNIFGTNAVFTNLSGTNLNAVTYSGTTFKGTTLSGTTLFGTNVSGVNVNTTNAVIANLSGTNVNAVTYSGTTFKGTTLSGTTLFGTNVSGVNLAITNAVIANLSGTNLNAVTYSGTTFIGTTLSGTNIFGTTVSGVDVVGVSGIFTEVIGGVFTGSGATFDGLLTVNDGASFSGADMDLNLINVNNFNALTRIFTVTSGTTNNFKAGSIGQLVDGGTITMADASVVGTSKSMMVVANATIASEAAGEFIIKGVVVQSNLNAGSEYYLSETAGAFTATAPTTSTSIVRILGYALTGSNFYFKPDGTYVEVP